MTYCRNCSKEISRNEASRNNGYCKNCNNNQSNKKFFTYLGNHSGFVIYLLCATFIIYLLAFQKNFDLKTGTRIIILLLMMFPFVFLPILLHIKINNSEKEYISKQKKFNSLSDTEKQKYLEQKIIEEQDKTINYTIIVGEDSKKSLGSAIVRGTVGGALLGPVGLVGGAISGKNKSETTFTIVYKSGRRKIETVKNDSEEFKEYAKYVK